MSSAAPTTRSMRSPTPPTCRAARAARGEVLETTRKPESLTYEIRFEAEVDAYRCGRCGFSHDISGVTVPQRHASITLHRQQSLEAHKKP